MSYISLKENFSFSGIKKIFIFKETELSNISRNGSPKKLLNFPGSKNILYFGEMELSNPKLKKLVLFQVELPKLQKSKFLVLLQKRYDKFF